MAPLGEFSNHSRVPYVVLESERVKKSPKDNYKLYWQCPSTPLDPNTCSLAQFHFLLSDWILLPVVFVCVVCICLSETNLFIFFGSIQGLYRSFFSPCFLVIFTLKKIKLPKSPLSMVIFWTKVRRSYKDLSSQADPTRENWTWSYPYFS